MADPEPMATAKLDSSCAARPPYRGYRFAFNTACGVAMAEPYGATQWRIDR